MKIKMAAIDLDGTLLHDDMSLSDFSKDIIRKAEHRGIRIVLATGRMFDAARPKAEELGLSDTPLICYTGAWIMMSRSGRPIWQDGVDISVAEKILLTAREKGWLVHTFFDDQIYLLSLKKSRATVEACEKSVEGKQREDVLKINELIDNYTSEKEKWDNLYTAGDRSLHNNQNIYNSVEKLKNDFEEKLRIADVYENLKKTANGEIVSDNSKITFERYIMGSYFEQVLYYANLRFSKMTGGRYEIVRGESRDKRISAGLEISVRDNFNNKERDISSLSGGESFQASLALALGLSDIIQQRNGGIRLDSIFIDEGFGSLDNDSLASAIETLNDLTGNGNRLVGIISHISELKNSIGNKIEVVGTKSGSSIKIITD